MDFVVSATPAGWARELTRYRDHYLPLPSSIFTATNLTVAGRRGTYSVAIAVHKRKIDSVYRA
ncbi:hypothetical protein PHLCEN_2v3728 [Hermanssonia centrifuga]|uniref:Uncharacterized protein n=1 Tax=Hermanssonia centrifuga TaxID=98765 RepID=A0A2R6QBQ1_9APHY|nr:hypothetical protein PHLCEN_2v3728 [Hermanssonia centrifuga]